MNDNQNEMAKAIGIFDSGIGGLTVMQQVVKQLPFESILYFGDTARVPYGSKSPETIVRYSLENAQLLMNYHIKALIVACHTASSYAMEELRRILPIPVIGVIEPSAKKAASLTRNGRIAVLGTKATINSGLYQKEIKRHLPNATVYSQACPLFVPLVEEGFIEHSAARMIVEEYLFSLKKEKVDTLLLGCTHYPLLHKVIQDVMGDSVILVDPAITCAETVSDLLGNKMINNVQSNLAVHRYFVSDDPEKFRHVGRYFLNANIDHVEKVHF